MADNKNISETLAERAYLSVAGKAVIGLMGGIILTIIGFFRREHNETVLQDIHRPHTWIKMEILDPPMALENNTYIFKHYASLGIDSQEAIWINKYIKEMTAHAGLVFPLTPIEIDSVNKLLHTNIDTQWTVRANDLNGRSFILVVKDKKIQNIISDRPIDSVIYPR
jgi:hypothetical protein